MISSERHALNCQIYRGLNRLNSLPAVKCWLTDICQSFNPSTQSHCFAKSKQNVANWRKKEQLILVDDKYAFIAGCLSQGAVKRLICTLNQAFSSCEFSRIHVIGDTVITVIFQRKFFFPV